MASNARSKRKAESTSPLLRASTSGKFTVARGGRAGKAAAKRTWRSSGAASSAGEAKSSTGGKGAPVRGTARVRITTTELAAAQLATKLAQELGTKVSPQVKKAAGAKPTSQ